MSAQWLNSGKIIKRILVKGTLTLSTPAHFGNGDAESPLDMPLMRDSYEGLPLLTGTSITGALRNYVSQNEGKEAARKLFGDVVGQQSQESRLIVDDSLGKSLALTEIRDGVSIQATTRTAEDKKKFDIQLLEAGTQFPLQFELLLSEVNQSDLLYSFAHALDGLEKGKIRLGKRKSRGYGQCTAGNWQVKSYNLRNPNDLIAWLEGDWKDPDSGKLIAELLNVKLPNDVNNPADCILEAKFSLQSSLLIRSSSGEADSPDMIHLHSARPGFDQPPSVVSGTSLAGTLRSRAVRIAKTLGKNADEVIDPLFGHGPQKDDPEAKLAASRIWVEETIIEKPVDMIQTRLKIDRFTAGAYPGALFDEQPAFGNQETEIKVNITIHRVEEGEIGLLILLLKDLWLGDLALGGESSVGRGCLKGKSADLFYQNRHWKLEQNQDQTIRSTIPEGGQNLQHFVNAFTGRTE